MVRENAEMVPHTKDTAGAPLASVPSRASVLVAFAMYADVSSLLMVDTSLILGQVGRRRSAVDCRRAGRRH